MTNRTPGKSPFVFRFAKRLPDVPGRCLRYDSTRQISQVLVENSWIDAPDARDSAAFGTRVTKVRAETQDDA